MNISKKLMLKHKIKSIMILTVHDSLVFDIIKSEREKLAKIIMHVFNNLPKYINEYFGIPWNVDLTGEVVSGPNYKQHKMVEI